MSRPPPALLTAVKKALSLPNPTYHLMLKRNPNSRFYLSPTIPYYRYDKANDVLSLPRGCLPRVRDWFDGHPDVETHTSDHRVRNPRWDESLRGYDVPDRPYQDGVLDVLLKAEGGGIVRLGTGWGKTHVALRLWSALRQRTLVLAPRKDILEQFRRQVPESEWIRYRTFQKAQKESQEFLDSFGCLIVDECHQSVAPGTWKLINRIPAHSRFGLSGTLERSDGQEEALRFLFGPVLVDRDLPHVPPKVRIINYEGRIGYGEYHEIAAALSEDGERNRLVHQSVLELLSHGRNVLVLTKRVEHAKTLHALLGASSRLAQARDSLAERSDRSLAFSSATPGRVLVGTYALLATGVDHPGLDTVVFAGDLKADTLARQSVGRVLRLLEGKLPPLVVDVQDRGNGILRAQARHRNKLYGRLGWELIPERD